MPEVYEGDAVIVEPYGSLGIISGIYQYDEYNSEIYGFHINSVEEWKQYWKNIHNFDLKDFTRVFKVLFTGNEHTYDYPETAIRKIIPFKKFRKIHRWKMKYCGFSENYIPFWKIFKRLKLYLIELKQRRKDKIFFSEVYGVEF